MVYESNELARASRAGDGLHAGVVGDCADTAGVHRVCHDGHWRSDHGSSQAHDRPDWRMSWELIAGGLALIFGAFGWWRVERHGAKKGELRQARRERDAARADDEVAARPPLTPAESVGVLRRVRDAYSRRR